MKLGLDDKPGLAPMLLYGLQWWALALPNVVISGLILARLHHGDPGAQILYLQKLLVVTGLATVAQVLIGHRLPLVLGPSSILLVALLASGPAHADAAYTAILTGGFALALLAASGMLDRLRAFFTPRIIVVVLILIAFTLLPTISRLILTPAAGAEPGQASRQMVFALFLTGGLLFCNKFFPGIWKSATVITGLAGGSLCYFFLFGFAGWETAKAPDVRGSILIAFDFDFGMILAFLVCFMALTINELGSIEAVGHMLRAGGMNARVRRGAGLQGAANMLAGALGVIGPVDFSMSAGVIAVTGCASRFTFVPAGIGLVLCAALPGVIPLLAAIPGPVMGALLFYLMATQLASGLAMLAAGKAVTNIETALTVALPLMTGAFIGFAPPQSFSGFPGILRPILSNGFVMGALAAIVLEHFVFRQVK